MTQTHSLQRRATPLLLAAIATVALLAGCDRRAGDTATGGTATPPPATTDTVPGTTPGAMPPASAASN